MQLGQGITGDFDSLLAKLVVHGADRNEAIGRMVEALSQRSLLGGKTDIEELARLINHSAFRAGGVHTGFVDQHAAALGAPAIDEATLGWAVIAAALRRPEFRALALEPPEPHASIGGWRN